MVLCCKSCPTNGPNILLSGHPWSLPFPAHQITTPPLSQTQLNDLLIQGNLHITCKLPQHCVIIYQWWAGPKNQEDASQRRLYSMLDQSLIQTLIRLNLLCNNYYSCERLEEAGGSMNPWTHDRPVWKPRFNLAKRCVPICQ